MSRKHKYRGWDTRKNVMYSAEQMGRDQLTLSLDGRGFINVSGRSTKLSTFATHIIPMEYTGREDKDGVEIYEDSIITFLMAFEITQTHIGDNIPRGSYTEPDEPFFHRITAQVLWDEDRLCWSYSIIGKTPYAWDQVPTWYDWETVLPLINREPYTVGYIKHLCGKCEEEECGGCEYLQEAGVEKFDDLTETILNQIEVIGNIHANPELMEGK